MVTLSDDEVNLEVQRKGVPSMVILSDDEVALIRSILIALRAIKVRDIDKALVVLSQDDRREAE